MHVQALSAEAWLAQQEPASLHLVLIDAFDGNDNIPASLLDPGTAAAHTGMLSTPHQMAF